MMLGAAASLTEAAEARRRELPATLALVILCGGAASAVLAGGWPIAWAAGAALLLIADRELYRRLDQAEIAPQSRLAHALAGWAFAMSVFFTALPVSLWLSGQGAGAAAAMVLWIVGVLRNFNGAQMGLRIALAGAAPPAFAMLVAPILLAMLAARPDWPLAVIAVLGGGALVFYAVQTRFAAAVALSRAARDDAAPARGDGDQVSVSGGVVAPLLAISA